MLQARVSLAMRMAVATAMLVSALATSFATTGRTCQMATRGNAMAAMSCCVTGKTSCHMPKPTQICACKHGQNSVDSSPAVLASAIGWDAFAAALPTEISFDWSLQPVVILDQRISWEFDLPPPETLLGLLPNRAPPSF